MKKLQFNILRMGLVFLLFVQLTWVNQAMAVSIPRPCQVKVFEKSTDLIAKQSARLYYRVSVINSATVCVSGKDSPKIIASDIRVTKSDNIMVSLNSKVTSKSQVIVSCPLWLVKKALPLKRCALVSASGTYGVKIGIPSPWGPLGGGTSSTWSTQFFVSEDGISEVALTQSGLQ